MADSNDGKALTNNGTGKTVNYDPSSEACTEEEEGEPPNIPQQQQSIIQQQTIESSETSIASSIRSFPSFVQKQQDGIHSSSEKGEKYANNVATTTTTTTTTVAHLQQPTTETKIDLHRPHTLTVEETIDVFKADFNHGLTTEEAKLRSNRDGPNVIQEAKGVSIWSIALRQVANALTVILLAAMALSFGVQDWVEGGVVSAVIVVNVVIGFVQEYRAENALASLRSLSSPSSSVIRDQGKIQEIDARQLCVGDIVHFKTGDVVPADVRIITLSSLEIDEAPLTGESVPVLKTIDALFDVSSAPLPPADRTNLAFAGTTVTKGRGAGVVVAIGMQTQIGQIAAALDKKNANKRIPRKADGSPAAWYVRAWEPFAKLLGLRDGTPLQRKLSRFALILLALAILCAIIVFAVAEFDLNDDVILYAIALGIGVLPESLVAVLTITFSVGAKRMANSNVIVRKLEALEALGGVTDICSDKTGTLTHGKMIVDKIWTPSGQTLSVEKGGSSVLEPVGQLFGDDQQKIKEEAIDNATKQLCLAASLCNVAQIWYDHETNQWAARGDPTEVALQVLARKVGMDREELVKSTFTFEQEHAFDSTTKRMTMMFSTKDDQNRQLFMKGAPERVLECCSTFSPTNLDQKNSVALNEEVKKEILNRMEILASQGLRVLAFASRNVDIDLLRKDNNKFASSTSSSLQFDHPEHGDRIELAYGQLPRSEAEQDFHFVGLCGLYDPPRKETYGSVKSCQNAGIVVRMITGDHIATARAIAKEVGILNGTESKEAVMSANEFDQLSEQEIDVLSTLPLVVARCSPTTKFA
ncbi:hypothetical protein IEQ34_025513 [Dendrobium chrysotoxum]|uniref:Cation-transporting P-type ATPase N-terminal domain-containing protein n=1 Tax=Dendrobium chrysotoxum TaxID=161865 RepID=A0AAV7FQ26_DENCH|nr:hypothetical protein IEQ34_025513 [Dendrobium chrysotoxum]